MSDEGPAMEWREALSAGRFDDAYRLYLLSGSPDAAPDGQETMRTLSVLSDVLQNVRDRSWSRARQKIERLEEPQPLLDWGVLRQELEYLERSSESLEEREAQEALATLQAIESSWFAAEASNQRGTARIYLGEFREAAREFDRAVELDPRHFRALTNLGNARLESGEVDEAIDCYQRALRVNDEFSNAHHNLGVAYRRKGQIGRSVKHLRRAQRVQQRVERERAREQVGRAGGQAGLKALRWSFIALGALVLYVLLRGRGFL